MKLATIFNLMLLVCLFVWLAAGDKHDASDTPAKPVKAAGISDRDLFCLVQNVYHEARGESLNGQAAVAYVTLNRLRDGRFGSSICDVVYQPDQFSWTGDGLPDRMTDHAALAVAVSVALAAWNGTALNPAGDALHFYAHKKVNPSWAAKADWMIVVDNHTFVKLRG
jgi:N-acetylmuramoyl-L-alanine amidase